MEAKELKIGNWVNLNEDGEITPRQIEFIGKDTEGYTGYSAHFKGRSCTLEDHFGDGDLDVNPIPLTEEILLKAGFVKDKHNYYSLFLSVNDKGKSSRKRIDFNQNLTICELCNAGTCFHRPECHYVHQLQNLYFALTNNELTINI